MYIIYIPLNGPLCVRLGNLLGILDLRQFVLIDKGFVIWSFVGFSLRFPFLYYTFFQGWGTKLHLRFCQWEKWRNSLFTHVALFGKYDGCLWCHYTKMQTNQCWSQCCKIIGQICRLVQIWSKCLQQPLTVNLYISISEHRGQGCTILCLCQPSQNLEPI